MKIMNKLNNVKAEAVEKAKVFGQKAKDAFEDHPDEVLFGVLMGGLVITYGQSIRYMHLLNKQAKNGTFKFIPGRGYVA